VAERDDVMHRFAAWLDSGERAGRPADLHRRQQRLRLDVRVLVLPSLHRQEPVRVLVAEPRLALQGARQGRFEVVQAPRRTTHTHDPVDDARGNAEALLAMQNQGLAIKL
jgi:hypothetical protein